MKRKMFYKKDYVKELLKIIRTETDTTKLPKLLSDYHEKDIAEAITLLSETERRQLYPVPVSYTHLWTISTYSWASFINARDSSNSMPPGIPSTAETRISMTISSPTASLTAFSTSNGYLRLFSGEPPYSSVRTLEAGDSHLSLIHIWNAANMVFRL